MQIVLRADRVRGGLRVRVPGRPNGPVTASAVARPVDRTARVKRTGSDGASGGTARHRLCYLVSVLPLPVDWLITACAAARRAIGTRNGLQLT